MNISLEWLHSFVDIPFSVTELADRLTMAGLEVEAIHDRHAHLKHVVTARVEKVVPHPNADRLSLCTVSDGKASFQIVCGAPNVRAGIVVPLALAGASFPSGLVIRETTIRGIASQGMLCSQMELELGDDASGIWVLPDATRIGVPLDEALDIQRVVLEISITPNRGDCLSVLGIAREVAAICGVSVTFPATNLEEAGRPIGELTSVTVDDPVGCPRYSARIVEGVTIASSPEWIRRRLEDAGLRSINNIVDVTNYVLLELGQPLHAFDWNRLRERRIVVRRANAGERLTTLDGVERTLFDDSLLICDGEGPVALAGIMGGLNSEIYPDTSDVLIESACFDPLCIRRTTKKVGLRSESSYRFERGVDPEGVVRALDRAAQLMAEMGGGRIAKGRIDVYPTPYRPPVLTLRVAKTNRFLGTSLSGNEMANALKALQMQVEEVDGGETLKVIPPTFRPDITREVDLAEEVVRVAGYDRVPVTLPLAAVHAEPVNPYLHARQSTKEALSAVGFDEVINYAFISNAALSRLGLPDGDPALSPIAVLNPLSEEQGVMRTSLVPGLLQTARRNLDHRNEDMRIYELSKVFIPRPGETLPDEPHQLAGLMSGRRNTDLLYGGEALVDYSDVKGVVEEILALFHLSEISFRSESVPTYLDETGSASVFSRSMRLGALGPVHSAVLEAFDIKQGVFLFELEFDRLFELRRPQPLFRSLPRFPSVVRDMALVVDESLPVQEVWDFLWRQEIPLLEQVEIFDIYRNPQLGAGKKSLGYRLTYRAGDRNLTDEEVNDLHGELVARVLKTFSAELR
jgi:phenylalanyl-tRNA synthetase beta chain